MGQSDADNSQGDSTERIDPLNEDRGSSLPIMQEIGAAVERAGNDSARRLVADAIEKYGEEPDVRLIASVFYARVGEYERSLAELGVLIALDPESPVPFKYIARILQIQGHDHIADSVLENGWKRYRAIMPRKSHERERASYFSFDGEQWNIPAL